jgi:hypothetical protein
MYFVFLTNCSQLRIKGGKAFSNGDSSKSKRKISCSLRSNGHASASLHTFHWRILHEFQSLPAKIQPDGMEISALT